MNNKNIRRIVVRQLKINHPYWKKLTGKTKKELATQVLAEVVSNYDYDQVLDVPIEELTGIADQSPPTGIRNLTQIAEYIDNFYQDNLFDFDAAKKPYLDGTASRIDGLSDCL